METRVDEIADRIYRLATFVPDVGPTGFTFNQFLIDADEPTIFHTGPRAMFPTLLEPTIPTNSVMLRTAAPADVVVREAAARGVALAVMGPDLVRGMTHLGVTDTDARSPASTSTSRSRTIIGPRVIRLNGFEASRNASRQARVSL